MDDTSWPAAQEETLPWHLDIDQKAFIPKSRRRNITSTYTAALPASIAQQTPLISRSLSRRTSEITAELARFDGEQEHREYRLPALMLRSESSASSQIENLTSSVRNVALAELVESAPANARLIAGNVSAMRNALLLPDELSLENMRAVHRALIEPTHESFGGKFRDEQVWIGGTPYSPHGATFVPPSAERVEPLLEDLVEFSRRDDLDPLVQTAIAHAQFETIHPFIDGNGRTGRVLVHKQLEYAGVLSYSTLPVSSGLLHDVDEYLAALDAYHEGQIEPIVETLCSALETALQLGRKTIAAVDRLIDSWKDSLSERAGSKIYELPNLLVEQPVVNASRVAEKLQVSERAARDLLARACEHGILEQGGNRKRGRFYQATELIAILEEAAHAPESRRLHATR